MFIEFIVDHPFITLLLISIIVILIIIISKFYDLVDEKRSEFIIASTKLSQQQLSTRKQLAEKTRKYQAGNLPWQDLIDLLFDANKQYPDDELIFKLYDLIEHEPKLGGFGGVSEEKWQYRQNIIANIIYQFEN